MSAWAHIKNGKYEEAIIALTEEIQISPSTLAFNNRGMAYLHLENYGAAFTDFGSADKISSDQLDTVCDGSMCGVALWMADNKKGALATWQAGVEASLAGTVRYGDAAGGLTIGNLLYFGGVRVGDSDSIDAATRLLRKRLRTKQSTAWPGPVSRYLLELASESDMLAAVSHVAILRERELCQACFYVAVHAFSAGDTSTYSKAMQEAFDFGSIAKLGAEYYLAMHEKITCNAINV